MRQMNDIVETAKMSEDRFFFHRLGALTIWRLTWAMHDKDMRFATTRWKHEMIDDNGGALCW